MQRVFISGGAGFIGSHFAERLLELASIKKVTAYDNLSSGKRAYLESLLHDERLTLVEGEITDTARLTSCMAGHDCVIHLASNPDIARAAREPAIDFIQGTCLTQAVLECARITGVSSFIYASGSGVYGELGDREIKEDHGPLIPISTYGASKLAGEALICSYCHMFSMRALVFRFANVVGSRQTHGVAFDFVRKLQANPRRLEILGDGTQSKSYIHVDDVIDAVLLAYSKHKEGYNVFNLATDDYISVKEIAGMVAERATGAAHNVEFVFTGGDRGWKGDVPVVRLSTEKIRALGWRCKRSSSQAISASLDAMIPPAVERASNR